MKDWWEQLDQQQRMMAIAGFAATGLLLFFLIAWSPALSKASTINKKIDGQRDTLLWMQDASAEIKSLSSSGTQACEMPKGKSLLSVVELTAQSANLKNSLKKVDTGTNNAKVTLSDAAFNDIVRWLVRLQKDYCVTSSSVSLKKVSAGKVEARITLEAPEA